MFASGHISSALQAESLLSHHQIPQQGRGYRLVYVILANISLQAGASCSSLQTALRIFPIPRLEFLKQAFMLSRMVWRHIFPLCINSGVSSGSLLPAKSLRKRKLTMGSFRGYFIKTFIPFPNFCNN